MEDGTCYIIVFEENGLKKQLR